MFFINEQGNVSYQRIESSNDNLNWKGLVGGFANSEIPEHDNRKTCKCRSLQELYKRSNLSELQDTQSVIEYIDTAESEGALIAIHKAKINGQTPYTHLEIHPSLILGVMGNQVVFPENNPLPRDLFACGQMRQAVSLYHSNYQTRIDKMGVVLNNGQVPLVKSRYLHKINNEEHPYGENVIVAIMCYGGYNVEDSILFNEGSVKRGLFRTTYYNSYEDSEESSKVGDSTQDSRFVNVRDNDVVGLKPGFDYGALDENGIIKENTRMDDKTVVIGKMVTNMSQPEVSNDASVFPKKGQLGFVDKVYVTDGEEGFRIAKVRVRDERVPSIGDKFCSRCGQKGTIGLIIPEESMPFNEDGMRPDIIINPHAIPSRMTIGQLVESQMGKACSILGGFGDCTAFMNRGPKHEFFGDILNDSQYHSSGTELLYNGETGEQLEAQIYMGPTYYMRLKHMVKDKINYRARGPRTALTRQTLQGRANDGGLRIGEMERDGVIAHGATHFLQESMLVRGDEYFMAVCNKTGMLAIYNEARNIFLSPFADGPIKYSERIDGELNIENISKYGRSFSIVRVPYAFKLLLQELQTMNIHMRIITDENIEQLSSMSSSNNISKLLGNHGNLKSKQLLDHTIDPEPIVDPEPIIEPIVDPEPIIEPIIDPVPDGSSDISIRKGDRLEELQLENKVLETREPNEILPSAGSDLPTRDGPYLDIRKPEQEQVDKDNETQPFIQPKTLIREEPLPESIPTQPPDFNIETKPAITTILNNVAKKFQGITMLTDVDDENDDNDNDDDETIKRNIKLN